MANDKNEYLTAGELWDFIENDTTDSPHKKLAALLHEAILDWPTSIKEPRDLIIELKKRIKNGLTYDNLEVYSKSLWPQNDAWKLESLASLLEMFGSDKTIDLETIIKELTNYCRQK